MKKLLAILLAMMLVMVSVAALAGGVDEDPQGGGEAAKPPITPGQDPTEAQTITIKKTYTFTVTDGATIPEDEIIFDVGTGTVTEATSVTTAPVVTIDKITIEEAEITATDKTKGKTYDLKINLPKFDEVGIYTYPVTEAIGKVVGVEYEPNEYVLKVTVIRNEDGELEIGGIALREKGDEKPKTDTIENSFGGGDLTVGKQVQGNMGDRSYTWTIKVTFTAPTGMTVGNTISYTPADAEEDADPVTIAAGWTGSKEVTLNLKHGETVQFFNLPAGIQYTVEETNKDDTYDTTGEVATATDLTAGESASVTVINEKEIEVDTGIALDSAVYMLIMALALAGFVALKIRRREEN